MNTRLGYHTNADFCDANNTRQKKLLEWAVQLIAALHNIVNSHH